ncbi:uncharacterized protein LOC126559966 [Anopheles maculipalpis]|uniref:uncharacterized protein LOC126559966 n=1 Tax=Anopheles maculipalpis TaxID=1496333 RepID=UPI00215972B9|nr:uncharacterized protein LOC126559966 [Anopheles maculipalpis]
MAKLYTTIENFANDKGEYPIHIAALSGKVENLRMLLSCRRTIIDQKTHDNKTAFELLCEIKFETEREIFECIALLLEYRAQIPEYFLNAAGHSTLRDELYKNYATQKIWTDEQQRRQHFNDLFYKCVTVDIWKFAIYKRCGETTNSIENLPEGILTLCCSSGNYELLEHVFEILPEDKLKQLLQKKKASGLFAEENLLTLLIHCVNENDNDCPFLKCLNLCLSCPLIDVDEIDGRKRRALDYAVKYNLKRVQTLLLEKGAYLGGRDVFGRYVLCIIDPIVLKQHLDSCVYTVSEGYESRECDRSNIFVLLKNFIPPKYKSNQWRRKPQPTNQSNESIIPALIQFTEESDLSLIKNDEAKDTRLQLIEHPVISTLLYIRDAPAKWYIQVLKLIRALPLILLLIDGYSMNYSDGQALNCMIIVAGLAMARCMRSFNLTAKRIYNLQIVYRNIWNGLLLYTPILLIWTAISFVNISNPDDFEDSQLNSGNEATYNTTSFMTDVTLTSSIVWRKLLHTFRMLVGELNATEMQSNPWSNITYIVFLTLIRVSLQGFLVAQAVGDISLQSRLQQQQHQQQNQPQHAVASQEQQQHHKN